MLRLAIVASIICALAVEAALADGSTPAAAPISPIATFDGEYFCIYQNQVYSAGAEICVGPNQALRCQAASVGSASRLPAAAQWEKSKKRLKRKGSK